MKYRKKPILIDAYQTDKKMIIHTLEGDMMASVGDYIITGVNGEQYPCKPDIFEKTHEIVEQEAVKAIKRAIDILNKSMECHDRKVCGLAETCEECPLYVDKDTEYEAHKVLLENTYAN